MRYLTLGEVVDLHRAVIASTGLGLPNLDRKEAQRTTARVAKAVSSTRVLGRDLPRTQGRVGPPAFEQPRDSR